MQAYKDVEIDIGVEDVTSFIRQCKNKTDLRLITESLMIRSFEPFLADGEFVKSLDEQLIIEYLQKVAKKYNRQEIERLLPL